MDFEFAATRNSMSHDQFNLNAYYDGELPPAESAAIAAHIESCPACQLELVKLAELSQHIRAFDEPMYVKPRISQIEMARLKAAVLKPPTLQINTLMPTARWLMRVAAILMVAGGAAVFVTTQNVSNAAPATWEEAAVHPSSVLSDDATTQSNMAEWVATDLSHGGEKQQ
jgi:anti-sigma factor RsiW